MMTESDEKRVRVALEEAHTGIADANELRAELKTQAAAIEADATLKKEEKAERLRALHARDEVGHRAAQLALAQERVDSEVVRTKGAVLRFARMVSSDDAVARFLVEDVAAAGKEAELRTLWNDASSGFEKTVIGMAALRRARAIGEPELATEIENELQGAELTKLKAAREDLKTALSTLESETKGV